MIAEQRPSAHSVVGEASLLLLSLEPPQPAARRAAPATVAARRERLERRRVGMGQGYAISPDVRQPIRRAAEATRHAARPASGFSLTPERVRQSAVYRPNSALTRPTSTAVFSAA